MRTNLEKFRKKVLDPNTSFLEVCHLFCQLIRKHPGDIIQALGLLYCYRSWHSQPPSDDAERIFRRIFLPLLMRTNFLTFLSAFIAMVIDPNVPLRCLMAIINASKRRGKDPWSLIRVAVPLRPSLADRIFRRQPKPTKSRTP